MNEMLEGLLGGDSGAVGQLARQFGLSPEQAQRALTGLAPTLTGAMGRNASKSGGLEALQAGLASGNHRRYLENPASLAEPSTKEDGNAILGHLLGSKDASRHVAAETAANTGLDVGIVKQMLPLVAALVMGSVGRSAGAPGGSSAGGLDLASVLGGVTGSLPQNALPKAGAIGGLLGDLFGQR